VTDAIEKLIDTYSGLAAAHPYMPTEDIAASRAELAALRAENARLTRALLRAQQDICVASCCLDRAEGDPERHCPACREASDHLSAPAQGDVDNPMPTVQDFIDGAKMITKVLKGEGHTIVEAQARQIAALREECSSWQDVAYCTYAEIANGEYQAARERLNAALSNHEAEDSSMRPVPAGRLREIEWIEHRTGAGNSWHCPVCDGLREQGHAPDCWLAATIAGKETK
jgi:hypothetical protein